MPARLQLQIRGLDQLLVKLGAERLLGPAVRETMEGTVDDVERFVQARAPRSHTAHSGRLAANLTSRMDASAVPTWGVVSMTARSRSRKYPQGYAYPRWLEFSSKSPRKGWVANVIAPARSALRQRLSRAKQLIEAAWSA